MSSLKQLYHTILDNSSRASNYVQNNIRKRPIKKVEKAFSQLKNPDKKQEKNHNKINSTQQSQKNINKRPNNQFRLTKRLSINVMLDRQGFQPQKLSRQFKIYESVKNMKLKNIVGSGRKIVHEKMLTATQNQKQILSNADIEYQKQNEFLLKNSSKLKLVYNQCRNKNWTIILPIQFILNQSNFWKQQEIDQNCIKTWRKLINIANIVWIIRKEKSLKKLINFCARTCIYLDTVYLIESRKRTMSVTVNMKIIKFDLNLENNSRIIVFNILKMPDMNTQTTYQYFEQKLPIINHKNTFVFMIRINVLNYKTFAAVLQCLQKQPELKLSIDHIWEDYVNLIKQNEEVRKIKPNYTSNMMRDHQYLRISSNDQVLKKLEVLKKEWINWMTRMKFLSNKSKMVQGESIQYIIGDLLKRNYPIFVGLYDYQNHKNLLIKKQSLAFSPLKKQSCYDINYNIPIFVWNV